MAEVGVAVIGFGLAGRVFHGPFVNAVPGLKLEAIVQRRGDEASKAYPKARILRSVDEALSDPAVSLIVVGDTQRDSLRSGEAGSAGRQACRHRQTLRGDERAGEGAGRSGPV